MASVVLNKYSPLVDRKKRTSGDRSYPIWLLVNPKYPTVLYDIWAPILYEIQDKVYRKLHARIDTENIFIKNAVSDIGIVPKGTKMWATDVAEETRILRESVLEYQPKIIITFGTMTYEFVNRALVEETEKGPKYWRTTNLENEFNMSIANFDIAHTNKIPLPRQIMVKGKPIDDRNYSSWEESETFFQEMGAKIADRIIENKDSLKIWI